MNMNFVHLHVHSNFSFERGTADILKLLQRCSQLGMGTVSLTDYDGLYGAIRLFRHAREVGIKPIIGTELTLTGNHQILLLAKNQDGYSNLCRLISNMRLSTKGLPVCTFELLTKYSRNLIALSGGPSGEIAQLILMGEKLASENALQKYLDIFGVDNFYLEVQDHLLAWERVLNSQQSALAKNFGVGIVATNNVHFLHREEFSLHKALVLTGKAVHHRTGQPKPNSEFYLKSTGEMTTLFREFPEANENTLAIAESCNVRLELDKIRVPVLFDLKGEKVEEILEKACADALPALFYGRTEQARKQLDHELEVVNAKRFANYFLMVRDIVNFARASGIRFSCRGSASSSIILYLLGISQVDPLENDLLFERFLNPERRDIPDIDLDFDSRRRDEVLDYVLAKYGQEMSCMVATVPTLEARSAVRELARVKGLSYEAIGKLTAYLPYIPGSQLRRALELLPELDASALKEKRYARLLEFAEEMGGFPHHLSVHLGGVVVWDHLADLVPMQRSAKGYPVAQYDKDDLEALGLVKTDILSLRMLGALSEAEDLIKMRNPGFDASAIPLDDSETYELLRSTRSVGCFQLESPGMRQLLGRLQPERFSDIVANISLFRPGPMQANMISPYIARRWGREKVLYLHPKLEPILKETCGVIVFQEQVLRISREIAGFSLGQADLLRRAMTKEITEKALADLRSQFVKGAMENGVPAAVAYKIFHQLAAFASFGFPKAHAASFAMLAYESCYLKRHYPLEFFLGLLNNEPGLYPPGVLANEARRCGVEVLAIDINESGATFTVNGGKLRTGFASIKGVGTASMEKIFKEREKGPFISFAEFCGRLRVQKKQLENLILCGTFDRLEPNRRKLLLSIRSELPKKDVEDFTAFEKARFELALTGLTFTGHPIAFLREMLSNRGVIRSSQLERCVDGEMIAVAGLKVVLHTPPTRSGRRVVFLTLEDEDGLTDVTVFSKVQQRDAKSIFGRSSLLVEGRFQRMYPRSLSLIADKVMPLPLAGSDQ